MFTDTAIFIEDGLTKVAAVDNTGIKNIKTEVDTYLNEFRSWVYENDKQEKRITDLH